MFAFNLTKLKSSIICELFAGNVDQFLEIEDDTHIKCKNQEWLLSQEIAVIHTVEKHKARNKDYALKKFIKYKDAFLFFYKFFSSFQKIRC